MLHMIVDTVGESLCCIRLTSSLEDVTGGFHILSFRHNV